MDASQQLKEARIVPVVVVDDPDAGAALAETLVNAGLRYVEVTLRTEKALAVIEKMANAAPDAVIGAGSVREASQIRQVLDAGARFAVSPGSSVALTDAARGAKMPFVPGGATASEIIRLRELGYSLVKFFPAELAGGTGMLKALGGPLPEVRFFPTGGITPALAPEYLGLRNVSCLGGTWITPADRLAARDFGRIGDLARQAADIAARAG
jgi:2-dehydro-3-deoxyphosphogluconate aldolase/(4S)-4-hydroxy-2-oxoglutarate aldolase